MRMNTSQIFKKTLPQSFRKKVKHLILSVEGSRGALPHFLIIGAAKAGTTALYSYLTQHPQIMEAKIKEIQFFSTRYYNGVMWYRSHFPLTNEIEKGYITGEASPYYLFHPHAPRRILQLLPNVKLIVLLRDPVDRAISHFFHETYVEKKEFLPIEQAFYNEEKRIGQELIRIQLNETYNSEIYRCYSYKIRGIYVDQLIRYLELFRNDQIIILKSEDFFSYTREILKDIFIFLNVDTNFIPKNLTPKNVGSYSTKVPDFVYKDLINYYAPHNDRLYRLLGRDFGWKAP